MGFSCENDYDGKEIQVNVIDETREFEERSEGMDLQQFHGVELDVEFWPVEHPSEPPDHEDRPVKCPLPDSSSSNDGGMRDKMFTKSLWKRAEIPRMVNEEGKMIPATIECPTRAVRKRHHHTLARMDHIITPLMRMPPLPHPATQNITVFQMLKHFDKFQS